MIIHPEGNTYNNPMMKAVLDLLCDKGVRVTLVFGKSEAPMPKYRDINCIPWGRIWGKIRHYIFHRFLLGTLCYLTVFLEWRSYLRRDVDLIIGVDSEGLIYASYLSRILDVPFVFISFEIIFESETSKRIKHFERSAAAGLSHWFTQDSLRRKLLIEENLLSDHNCSILPLSSKGIAEPSTVRLRDSLNIPKDSKVAIIIGSLADWTMTPDVLRSVASWKNEWCLIVHSRYGSTTDLLPKLGVNVSNLVGKKIFISNSAPAKVDDLSYVLSGVDAGLAFYKPVYNSPFTGKNIENIGLASGKISTFLRNGIPIVVNEIGEYATFVRKYGFGCVITEVSDLEAALSGIDHAIMSPRAKDFFRLTLDFTNYEQKFWEDLINAGGVYN